MAYYTEQQLHSLGFKHVGKGVKISDKASIYNFELIELGDFCRVDDFCVLSGNIKLGKYVYIGPMCLIAGGLEKEIIMEDFSTLAYGVKVFTQSDDYTGLTMTNSNIPAKYKKEIKESIKIARHVIIGTNAVIFPGSILNEGVSVGAVSLVKGILEPWSIYIGIPAIKIKERKKDLLKLEAEFKRK